ncbi:unnamed protein product [Notodromas monacha]|uniref:Uncharacterized protein n=1 Tax=Notodromas monacha TaxID=399045 RepID=A0A7R9BR81_9CRUS|nr:unnamed protein product [Notodromas monacha]CAG0920206.1 unnamed protein product [Notodromas monacha]
MTNRLNVAENGPDEAWFRELSEILKGDQPADVLSKLVDRINISKLGDATSRLFHSLSDENDPGCRLRHVVFTSILNRLKQSSPRQSSDAVVCAVQFSAESFPPLLLVKAIKDLTNWIINGSADPNVGQWLEVFPKLLSLISEETSVPDGPDRIKGSDYLRKVVCMITSESWAQSQAVRISSALLELDLMPDETNAVTKKLEHCLIGASLQDLPAIAMRLITTENYSRTQTLLHLLSSTFASRLNDSIRDTPDNPETISLATTSTAEEREIQECIGTMVLQVCSLVDGPVGDELVKLSKDSCLFPASILTPFTLSLFVAMAMKEKYSCILENIVAAFVAHFALIEQMKDHVGMRELGGKVDWNPTKVVREAVEIGERAGCEPIEQGLLSLAFALVKSAGKEDAAAAFGASQLATEILVRLVKRESTSTVLSTFSYLISTSANQRLLADVFSRLVKSAGRSLITNGIGELKSLCLKLGKLPLSVAYSVMHALAGLLKFSQPLKDAYIIALKKTLFSKHKNDRLVGVSGILMLVENCKIFGTSRGLSTTQDVNFSLTQQVNDVFARPTQFGASKQEAAVILVRDALFTLRICLSQKAEVKEILYRGLTEAVRKNPELGKYVLNFVLPTLKKYVVDADEDPDGRRGSQAFPPFDVNACIVPVRDEGFALLEPVGDLLTLVAECVSCEGGNAENFTARTSVNVENAQKLVGNVSGAYAEADVTKLIPDDADLSPYTNGGQFNVVWKEAGGAALSTQSALEILEYFKLHSKVHDKLLEKEKSGAKAKKNAQPQNSQDTERKAVLRLRPYEFSFSAHFLESCLCALFGDDDPDHMEGLPKLRADPGFVCTILSAWQEKLSCQPGCQMLKIPVLQSIGKVLLSHCDDLYASTEDSDRNEVAMSLECLGLAMKLVQDVHPQKFWTHLCVIGQHFRVLFLAGSPPPQTDRNGQEIRSSKLLLDTAKIQCQVFKKVVGNVLDDDEKVAGRAVAPALNLITALCRLTCEFETEFTKQTADWLVSMFEKEGKSLDGSGIRAMLTAWCSMTLMGCQTPHSSKHLADRIVSIVGAYADCDDASVVENPGGFGMLQDKAWVTPATLALCGFLDKMSDSGSIIVNRLKRILPLSLKENAPFYVTPSITDIESKVCVQIGLPCFLHGTLIIGKIGQVGVDTLSKSIVKSINVQTNLARYLMLKYVKMKNDAHLPPKYVRKVVQCENLPRKRKADPSTEHARVRKMAKKYSDMIFGVERYEQVLLQLSKKCHVNLLEGARLPTARDFKIDRNVLLEELGDQVEAEDDEAPNLSVPTTSNSQAEEEAVAETPLPQAKKRKTLGPKRKKTMTATASDHSNLKKFTADLIFASVAIEDGHQCSSIYS